jgi:eukaryotic-like serine/threonine-protein kinase
MYFLEIKMYKIILSTILISCLTFMTGCTSATPTPIISTMPPVQPTAILGITPTERPITTKEPAWTFATGMPIWGPITVSNGVVYFGSEDGFLYAVDTRSHALIWKYQTGGAIRSRPAIANNLVYIASDNSFTYALSINDGTPVWKIKTGDPGSQRNPMFSWNDYQLGSSGFDVFTSSPTVQDNTVYVGGRDDYLYAIDANTGQVKWKFHAMTSLEGIRQTPVVGNGMVYFGDIFGNFYAIDINSGNQVWAYPITGNANYSNQATLIDQTVYVTLLSSVVALDATTGKEKWKTPSFAPSAYAIKTPAYADGVLYAEGIKNGNYFPMAAYDTVTGKLLWVSNPANPEGLTISSPAVGNNNVYTGTFKGGLFAINKQTGVIQWVIPVLSGEDIVGVNSSPVVAEGMVYFGGMDGNLYAVADQ